MLSRPRSNWRVSRNSCAKCIRGRASRPQEVSTKAVQSRCQHVQKEVMEHRSGMQSFFFELPSLPPRRSLSLPSAARLRCGRWVRCANPRLRASAAWSIGLENRSAFKLLTSNFALWRRSRLPCPAPSDAIRAPRPSFRRSSMPAVPSASSSFRVANRDVLSAASRTPSRWNVHSGSAGRGDSFPSATSIRPTAQNSMNCGGTSSASQTLSLPS